jgi:hypothetical protein
MKSSSDSRLSLDIPPINVSLKHNFIAMARVKKTALALSAWFSLEVLFLGLFPNGTFDWTNLYVPSLLKAAYHTDAGIGELVSPAKTDGASGFENYGEVTPGSGGFLAANETAEVFLQSFVVVPLSFRFILAPKVSRYLAKSVLIL